MGNSLLPHFGIHQDVDGFRHLFQDLCPEGFNYVGLKGQSGMSVRKLTERCPHAIVPSLGLRNLPSRHWERFLTLIDDPLVQAMLPIPEDNGAVFLEQTGEGSMLMNALSCLERMSTPMYRSILPFWATNQRELKKYLRISNIHPVVLIGAELGDSARILKYLELAQSYPRKLIIVGSRDIALPSDVPRIETGLLKKISLAELISLPMEHIGGEIIKRYCRKQELNAPMSAL